MRAVNINTVTALSESGVSIAGITKIVIHQREPRKDEPKMPSEMNIESGKQITEIWMPGDGNANHERVRADGQTTLEYLSEYHGDHSENWVVQKQDGKEVARYNTKQITSIYWTTP